jgi:hypothetical protein
MSFPGEQVVSSMISGGMDYLGTQAQNRANKREARKNREFQEYMSSTSYQRARKDLEAANLNPILAVTQGGASSPGGAQAHMENALGRASSSARQAMLAKAEVDNLLKQNKKIEADTELSKATASAQTALESFYRNNSTSVKFDNVGKEVQADMWAKPGYSLMKQAGMYLQAVPGIDLIMQLMKSLR